MDHDYERTTKTARTQIQPFSLHLSRSKLSSSVQCSLSTACPKYSHKIGTYITLPNTYYIFPSLQHYTPYAAITQVESRAPDDGLISAPKHVEQITNAIKHSVASSCVSSLRLHFFQFTLL